MRNYRAVIAIIALFIAQSSFANVSDTNKSCEMIANACLSGGFVKAGDPGKTFWRDCMKPILLGQTITGVNVSAKDAMACRQYKIAKMKQELKEFQQVMSTKMQTN